MFFQPFMMNNLEVSALDSWISGKINLFNNYTENKWQDQFIQQLYRE